MLGEDQERWLARGFRQSLARWNFVAQQLLIAELEHTLPGTLTSGTGTTHGMATRSRASGC